METQSPPPVANPLSTDEILRLNSLAEEVDIDSIIIGPRVRRDFIHVPALAESIKEEGLIQPIVLSYDKTLIAGESRIRAHRLLGRKTIRAVFRGVLDDAQLAVLEATENNARANLTWQERILSVDKVHRIRATKAMLSGEAWGVRETGRLLNQGKTNVGMATYIAGFLHANDEEIWKADSAVEAYRILCTRKEQEAARLLAKQTVPVMVKYTGPVADKPKGPIIPAMSDDAFFSGDMPMKENVFGNNVATPVDTGEMPGTVPSPTLPEITTIPLSSMLLRETGGHNSLQAMRDLGPDSVDHIVTDPPYGIDMDNLNQSNPNGQLKDVDTVLKEHDVNQNLLLLSDFIKCAFTVVRPRGFVVFWCDPVHWWNLTEQCAAAGFSVQRWPLIWMKTSACQNQAAQTNWTKNVEFAVVARKGTATLVKQQPSCVWTGGNDTETRALGHPFAKPFGLWKWVYDAVAIRGQEVLDPFVGCGSSMVPAIKLGLRPRGIECSEVHYNRLVVNVQNVYKSIDSTCQFS